MRGAVAAAIDQVERLGGVGQRDQQGMIAPGAVVGDVDALLALGVGADQGAVGVDDRLVEELAAAARPRRGRRVWLMASIRARTSASENRRQKSPGGGGVGDALGAQGVEIDLVVAPQLEVFDPLAAGEDVEGDVQDVVGFVVGQMPLEEVEVGVDVVDQPDPASQQEHGADAAGAEALDAIGQLVVDVGGGHHGFVSRSGPGPILDAVEDPPLALVEDPAVAVLGVASSYCCVFGASWG